MPVLSLACHLPHNAPHIAWRYNYEQTTKQTKAINNSYIYINISCKCDTNRAGHLTLDAYASRPVACGTFKSNLGSFRSRALGLCHDLANKLWLIFEHLYSRWYVRQHNFHLVVKNCETSNLCVDFVIKNRYHHHHYCITGERMNTTKCKI